MPKLYKLNEEARISLEKGIEKLATIVKSTLGPKGRNVIIDRPFNTPMVSNDGVFIAQEIELDDPFENMGAMLVKEVAKNTNEIAGDGTTTAIVLAQSMVRQGNRFVREGANPIILKIGIEKAVRLVVDALKESALPLTDHKSIAQVASISSKDKEIGEMIADAMDRVGTDGIIHVEESNLPSTILEVVKGMRFDRGYISHNMVTNFEKMETLLEDPYILITDQKINSIHKILPLMEQLIETGKPLFIIAEDVGPEVLGTLMVNQHKGNLQTVAVRAPEFGYNRNLMLEDIAVMTGGQVISESMGRSIENTTIEDLGRARQVVVNKDQTAIIEGFGKTNEIQGRKDQIRQHIEDTAQEWEKEKLQERLSRLSGGVAVILAGGITSVERREKLLRIEDALNATLAAVEEGIVVGGGTALLKVLTQVEEKVANLDGDTYLGTQIVLNSLSSPLLTIANNCGVDGQEVVEKVISQPNGYGFNALSGEYVDLISAGIIDPVKVTCSALQNAASIAALIITTDSLITEKAELALDPTEGPSEGAGAELLV
ncbi:chaperonin GroEL [Paenisporosarcina antarctica]|uniref:Chaperonin GroEL n=1 Tax=Paenisporosarcina antarctica TaxID=417367 RepID=A0A4P6ZUU3_9BACL|nr:chaperonin GroEL [Paenisporosarcina antarctica]QBP39874.1 chaperonin GroEL [Paenisporosarcina antarctica]